MSSKTIFLTPAEAERIRMAFKGRVQRCLESAGQARGVGDQKARLNQVATAALLADIAGEPKSDVQEAMVAYAVGFPYSPCTVLLQELRPMELADLRMEMHHRGRVLRVRRVAEVVKLVACSWTVVRDELSGEMERLEVLLHKSRHGQDILESGTEFEIKEPYYTLSDQGEATLRVEHPSDLVIRIDSPDSSAQEVGDSDGAAVPAVKTAREYKEEGNAALKRQAFWQAHANYTRGLQLVTASGAARDDLACDLFRNRARVNLVLKRFDEAKADALASLTGLDDQQHRDLDSKAYFRAGSAAQQLGEFEEAKRFFEEQKKLRTDKETGAWVQKTESRLLEQETGVYDFKTLKAGLLLARPGTRVLVDAASFVRNVEVRPSPGRGRGLFATREMEAGAVIMCEKAFCVAWGREEEALTAVTYDGRDDRIRVFPAGLCRAVVQKLLDNPSQVGRVLDLYGDYEGIGGQVVMRDSGAVIDTFQVHDIVARNAFGCGAGEEDVRNASTGLWIWASYINHSCIPNAKREYVGDLMVLRATRALAAGEEITQAYDESSDYDARTEALMKTWGFTCSCALCVAEEEDGAVLRKRRRELKREAEELVERSEREGGGAKRLVVLRARGIARAIGETYDEERYKGLPRRGLIGIQKWITGATPR